MNARRILIVRLSAIGDVVHVLPALAALRRALPEAHLAWIVEKLSAPLIEGHSLLDEVILYPRAQWRRRGYVRSLPGDVRRFFGDMRRRRFDVAIDFQGLTKSAMIARFSGIPLRVGYGGEDGREISPWLNNRRLTPPDDVRHVVARNLYLLKALGIENPPVEFPFPDYSEERERIDACLEEEEGIGREERLVFMNPGAGWETKRWPPEYYGRLAGMIACDLGYRVFFTWGPGEERLVEEAYAAVPQIARDHVRWAPPTTVRELAALLDRGVLMIGGDTGPVHLAAARGVPAVCIYGGSDPNRNSPLGSDPIRILDNPELECYPCWQVRCDNPPPRCMTTVEPEAVFEAVRAVLETVGSQGTRMKD